MNAVDTIIDGLARIGAIAPSSVDELKGKASTDIHQKGATLSVTEAGVVDKDTGVISIPEARDTARFAIWLSHQWWMCILLGAVMTIVTRWLMYKERQWSQPPMPTFDPNQQRYRV